MARITSKTPIYLLPATNAANRMSLPKTWERFGHVANDSELFLQCAYRAMVWHGMNLD